MADHDDLHRTITALRAEVPMRAEWRGAVLREAAAIPRPVADARRLAPSMLRDGWRFRPSTAIAAGLLCAVLGGALTLGVQRLVGTRIVARSAADTPNGSLGGAGVSFVLVAPAASSVAIAGDFNGWSPSATPMRRTAAGLWSIDLPLAAGRHTYAFVVDGVLVPDPNALDSADEDFGVRSSVVLVSEHRRT
jgi:hypothetical protein